MTTSKAQPTSATDALPANILPAVADFLSRPLQMYIGGAWCDAAQAKTFEVRDPGSSAIIARVAAGHAADVERAVAADETAFHRTAWATMPANDRAVILHPGVYAD